MTNAVLSVDADAGRRTAVRNALFWKDIRTITASSGTDAIARLTEVDVDCVVTAPQLSDMRLETFRNRVREYDSRLPVVSYGESAPPEPGTVERHVPDSADWRTLSKAVANAIDDREAQAATERYAQLTRVVRTAVTELTIDGPDRNRSAIENRLYELLATSNLYGFVWLGAYVPAADQVTPRLPEGVAITTEEGAPEEALSTGQVHVESAGAAGTRAAVPLVVDETVHGLVVLYADAPGAFAETEQEALEDLGRAVGQAIERAEQADSPDELAAYAGLVTHELRNHLQVAQAHLGKLGTRGTDERGSGLRHALALIEHADERSNHLDALEEALSRIDRLADDAAVLARRSFDENDREWVDVASVAQEAWEATRTGQATLEVDAGSVDAHRSALRLLFENLFRNAVQHGGEAVSVTVRTDTDRLVVSDDGRGIPPCARGRALQWGYSTDENGSGIGLALVDRLATAHGWEVALNESDAGGLRVEVHGVDVTGRDSRTGANGTPEQASAGHPRWESS